jgi:type IV pilus assembly protein PilW
MRKVRDEGFTLIELLVAITIGVVVIAGISMSFRSQQRSYLVQEQVATMQQNLRAAMYHIEREIRMAGCDPTFSANASIITANVDSINFTMDIRGAAEGTPPDGDTNDPNENITYRHYDSDGDGVNDALGRDTGAGTMLIASHIDAVDFLYYDAQSPPVAMNPAGGSVLGPNIPNIKSIEITLVARTSKTIRGYTDTATYSNQLPRVIFGPPAPPDDNFRRIRLTTRIKGRNL